MEATFNTLTQIESLIAEIRSLTAEDICDAGRLITPIQNGTPITNGELSTEAVRIYSLLIKKWEHLLSVGDTLEQMRGASRGNDMAGTETLMHELSADTAVLWEMIEYECLRRFPTSEGRNQSYDIGPGFRVFLLPSPQEEDTSETRDSDEDIEKYFIPTHPIQGPSGLPN